MKIDKLCLFVGSFAICLSGIYLAVKIDDPNILDPYLVGSMVLFWIAMSIQKDKP